MNEKLDIEMFLKAMKPIITMKKSSRLPHRGTGAGDEYIFFLKLTWKDEIEKLENTLKPWGSYLPDENKLRKMGKFPNYLKIRAYETVRGYGSNARKEAYISVSTTFLRGMGPSKKEPIQKEIDAAYTIGNIVSFAEFAETVDKNLFEMRGRFLAENTGII